MTHSTSTTPTLYGAIEAGGTKIVCAVAYTPLEPLNVERFATADPDSTIANIIDYFKRAQVEHGALESLAIGAFGPVDVNPLSKKYGTILKTPKQGWEGVNILHAIKQALGEDINYKIDTDVNAAALGEYTFGAGRGNQNVSYVTVGTGIGASYLVDGRAVNGRMHSEIGHMAVPNLEDADSTFTNTCKFHSNCLEGWAAGPAIEKRWGCPGKDLPEDHPAWDLQAKYLAQGVLNITASWSPDVIIFGGGVMQQDHLIEKVRIVFEETACDYWSLPPLDHYIQKAELDQMAGIIGALLLAQKNRRATQFA